MILFPLVERELRVSARRWQTYWKRSAFGLVAVMVGALTCLGGWNSPSYRLSGDLFGSLVFLAMLVCLGFGLFSTADCLSQEKREGTLGLLFLTDLKGYDVVLGETGDQLDLGRVCHPGAGPGADGAALAGRRHRRGGLARGAHPGQRASVLVGGRSIRFDPEPESAQSDRRHSAVAPVFRRIPAGHRGDYPLLHPLSYQPAGRSVVLGLPVLHAGPRRR